MIKVLISILIGFVIITYDLWDQVMALGLFAVVGWIILKIYKFFATQ